MRLRSALQAYARLARPLVRFCALAAVLLLPLTSLPLLSRLMGGTMVAPPSLVFVALGLMLYLPLLFLGGERWPAEIVPLAAFVGAALLSSLLSFFSADLPLYKDVSLPRELFSALLTLLAGCACFFFFAVVFRDPGEYRPLLALVNLGGVLIVAWCLFQLYYIYLHGSEFFPPAVLAVHRFLSLGSLLEFLRMKRVAGFAFEPSWLAHQLNMLYLPYWLGASLAGYSAWRFRLWRFSAENLLLLAGILLSYASLSRIGYLTLLLVLAFLVWQVSGALAGRLGGGWRRVLAQAGMLTAFAALAALGVYLLARLDGRVAAIFTLTYGGGNFFYVANQLALAERFAYWGLGWNVFTAFPWLGVGLGNVGFYFESHLPQFGWALSEFQKIHLENTFLVNPKNLWLRLLAETGILGFALFASWLYLLFASARTLQRCDQPLLRALGWMGMLGVIALLGEGFSVDSFALPYAWTTFGLAVSASFLARRQAPGQAILASGKD
ncbi:MAG: O-antigen ligase family protein [Anaerolineales bacterium]